MAAFDLSKSCRTKLWVSSLANSRLQRRTSSDDAGSPTWSDDGEQTTDAKVLSPMSDLAMHLSSSNLDTPNRRLSLDTASNDTPIATPKKSELRLSAAQRKTLFGTAANVIIDSAEDAKEASFSRCRSPYDENAVDFISANKENGFVAPPTAVGVRSSTRPSDGSDSSDGLRSPCVSVSPAPSSVFILDEDSQDSGYGGERDVQKSNVSSEFVTHIKAGQECNIPKVLTQESEDGFDGFLDEIMQVDQRDKTSPEVFAGLLDQPLLDVPRMLRSESTAGDFYHDDTPSKRKSSMKSLSEFFRHESLEARKNGIKRALLGPETETLAIPRASVEVKRRRSHLETSFTSLRPCSRPITRCHSEADASVALQRGENCSNLVGDYSMPLALPIVERPHVHDLKSISADTVCKLIRGEFRHMISSFALYDCRYPYEYEAGHIRSAVNVFTRQDLVDNIFSESATRNCGESSAETSRHIVIFYCEYSRERGPRMSRFLRQHDRTLNEHQYPKLYFPEIYLLDGGYKNFYSFCSEYCEPNGYKPMDHQDHASDLRACRAKSRSWCDGGDRTVSVRRPGLNRGLRF